MFQRILTVAGQEFRIGLRNRWILLSVVILAAFSMALALLGSAPAGTLDVSRMTITVASLSSLSVYLVPLIALLLAFDAVAGEIERGTLLLIFSSPMTRSEFLIGKAVGHICVLLLALTLGYGATAGMLAATGGGDTSGFIDFARLIGTSAILGFAFLALGYIVSALVRQVTTAAAMAIGIWLVLIVLYDLALLGALVADSEGFFASTVFPFALLANPADAFRLFNLSALNANAMVGGMAGVAESLPFPPAAALASIFVFAGAAMSGAILLLKRVSP
ncbi:Membrane protein nosY [Pseudovibrio sp. FO-BEG1]|uniref:ABC transporter permease n=1 Tax=unclassified Pseudovibrio TaxID=2627060 RepID=UPI000238BDD3|nr:ABC transporter permease subunit [Pseudovibrio sp. FO-BEG1]AEV37639.1 Membrane protein nosY [Pseudovibrio sp. FO-BEG1]